MTVTIHAHNRSYRIGNPGGRIGVKLAAGVPYERKLLEDVYRLDLQGAAFDIGAHVGNHSLWLAAVCGLKVHAFEPFPTALVELEANTARNPNLDVTVHPWAAGAEDSHGRFRGRSIDTAGGDVPVHRIDDHLDVTDLAVVKVDVEGMEAAALQGAIRHLSRCLPVVYAEAHTVESTESVGAVLRPLGYRRTKTIRMGSPMDRWEGPR